MELYRIWYQNGAEPASTLSMATSLEAIEFTERNNTNFLRAEVATLTQEELEWQAEMMLPVLRMAMERCDGGA